MMRGNYKLDPPYQRESGAWSLEKKRLFIDSLLNSFDTPKIYIHDISSDKSSSEQYAIIDGLQRMTTIWDFRDNKFTLDDGFKISRDHIMDSRKPHPQPGDSYSDLDQQWQNFFDNVILPITVVKTADDPQYEIEDMFARLNNGEPLNAAEKRNAKGGDMIKIIKNATDHPYFVNKVAIANKRYRHDDHAARIVLMAKTYLSEKQPFTDLKRKHLDTLVDQNKQMTPGDIKKVEETTKKMMNAALPLFDNQDPLLRSNVSVSSMVVFAWTLQARYGHPKLKSLAKDFLEKFEARRLTDRQLPENQRDPLLAGYNERIQQASSDMGNVRWRTEFLIGEFLVQNPDVKLKDKKRLFNQDIKYATWIHGGKICSNCDIDIQDFSDVHADHIDPHSKGGQTTLANLQILCQDCNLQKSDSTS